MMSIFVPKTFGYSADRIKGLVERDLGKVRQVDIVKETCFIHLDKWYEGDKYPTFQAIDRMEKGEAHKITSFDHRTGSYTTLFLLKNHSKKQCQEVNIKEVKQEKDVLEQIEEGCCSMEVVAGEGCGDLKPLSLVHPDSLAQPQQNQQGRWRPPSPPGPPPALVRSHQQVTSRQQTSSSKQTTSRQNRTEGRLPTDDQYIFKLETEIASLRAQNHAYVKEINELRIYNYTQQVAQDDRRKDAQDDRQQVAQEPGSIAGSEYNANAIPKSRRRAGAAPRASSSDVRLETF